MGYHLYHFYEDDDKLAKVLARFFMEGLRKHEYCMWIVPEGVTHDRAIVLLKRHIPDIEDFLLKDQMRIEMFEDWYLTPDGKFDADTLIAKWKEKYDEVMGKGFLMMRVGGGGMGSISDETWDKLMDYEAIINDMIGELNFVAVCAYKGKLYKPSQIQTILKNHFCPLTPNP